MVGFAREAWWLPVFGSIFATLACGQAQSSPHESGAGSSGQGAAGTLGVGGAQGEGGAAAGSSAGGASVAGSAAQAGNPGAPSGGNASGGAGASGASPTTSRPACYDSNALLGVAHVDAGKPVTHACETQGHSLTQAELEPLLGSYEVTHFTRNPKGCDTEGASCLLPSLPLYAVLSAEAGSAATLQLGTCASVAACKAGKFDGSAFEWLGKALADGSPCATQFGTGYRDQLEPVCHDAALVNITLSRVDATHLRLTERTALFDAPETDTGGCSSATAELELEAPCSALRVLELRWVEP